MKFIKVKHFYNDGVSLINISLIERVCPNPNNPACLTICFASGEIISVKESMSVIVSAIDCDGEGVFE